MLFTIQSYLEEYLINHNIDDNDGYAVHLANLYFYHRFDSTDKAFLNRVGRIRTVLFINNGIKNRKDFENALIHRLDINFKKKLVTNKQYFPGGTETERRKLQLISKLTIDTLLNEFIHATEARAVDAFWISRKKGTLRQKPEKIAQALFAVFTRGTLINRSGIVLREFLSGIGFVDIGIIFSSTLHLVEIKILSEEFTGPNQLEAYMNTEQRSEGSLLIFDSIAPDKKINLPSRIDTTAGVIKVYNVDINPSIPSSMN